MGGYFSSFYFSIFTKFSILYIESMLIFIEEKQVYFKKKLKIGKSEILQRVSEFNSVSSVSMANPNFLVHQKLS